MGTHAGARYNVIVVRRGLPLGPQVPGRKINRRNHDSNKSAAVQKISFSVLLRVSTTGKSASDQLSSAIIDRFILA